MSCLWKFFSKKQRKNTPIILSDSNVSNPLNLDELSDDITVLKATEFALIKSLVSIHYTLEESKKRVATEFRKGSSKKAQNALAKRVILGEQKKLFEGRLQRVQAKLNKMQ